MANLTLTIIFKIRFLFTGFQSFAFMLVVPFTVGVQIIVVIVLVVKALSFTAISLNLLDFSCFNLKDFIKADFRAHRKHLC